MSKRGKITDWIVVVIFIWIGFLGMTDLSGTNFAIWCGRIGGACFLLVAGAIAHQNLSTRHSTEPTATESDQKAHS